MRLVRFLNTINEASGADNDTLAKLIANDEELWDAVSDYVVGGQTDRNVASRIAEMISQVKPFTPHFRLYRGEPDRAGGRDDNKFFSASANPSVAARFGNVEELPPPYRGVSIDRIAYWRGIATGESIHPGAQSEWLVIPSNPMNEEQMVDVWHLTDKQNVPSITQNGLEPRTGAKSKSAGEKKNRIYVFPDLTSVEDALTNWWYDNTEYRQALLQLRVPESWITQDQVRWEATINHTVPPNMIKVAYADVSDVASLQESTDAVRAFMNKFNQLEKRYPQIFSKVFIDFRENQPDAKGGVWIDSIVAKKEGKGHGTQVMNAVTKLADQLGLPLALEAEVEYDEDDEAELWRISYFEKFGFHQVGDWGSYGAVMFRPPQTA